jgi:DNA-binding MurR/RpiR family transcriptional regulator
MRASLTGTPVVKGFQMDTVPAPAATAPATVEEFRDRLSAQLDDLPKRLRQCAEHIAAHTDRIAVSTVAELAAGAEVPPSALMRFCQIMGFSGFSEMQKLFRDAYAPGWPDYSTRLRNLKDQGRGSPAALLAEFVEAGRMSLEVLATSVDEAALNRAVEVLAGAETVHVVGLRRAFPVASYLAYVFEKMQVSAMLHDGVGKLDHRFALRAGDALLAITFAPYSEETIALAQDAGAHLGCTVPEVDFGAFRSLSATIAMAISLRPWGRRRADGRLK